MTMAFVASAISFCVSSFLTGSLMRGSTRFADLLIVLSLLVLGSAFSLFGPMFPLTLPPVVSPAVATLVSQSLLGLASGTLHVTAVTIGLADLEDMGDTRDESFSTAYASLILSATTLGSVESLYVKDECVIFFVMSLTTGCHWVQSSARI